MPLSAAAATCDLKRVSCVSFSAVPRTVPKMAVKSPEAMGEMREVKFVLARVAMGPS